MGNLIGPERVPPITLPKGARTIGLWVRTDHYFRNLSLWAQVKDTSGGLMGLSLGKVESPEWEILSADIPERLKGPIELAAIHISEPGQGNLNTPGDIYLDDIHTDDASGEQDPPRGVRRPNDLASHRGGCADQGRCRSRLRPSTQRIPVRPIRVRPGVCSQCPRHIPSAHGRPSTSCHKRLHGRGSRHRSGRGIASPNIRPPRPSGSRRGH